MHMHYRKVDFIKQYSYRFDNRVHHERMWPLGVELLLGNEIANYKDYIKINIKTRSKKLQIFSSSITNFEITSNLTSLI